MTSRPAFAALLLHVVASTGFARSAEETPEKVSFFEAKVRPLLSSRCVECHGAKKQGGGLRLDNRSGWSEGGDSGPAIVPGKPEESLIVRAVGYADKELRMPPKKALPPAEAAILSEWIKQGAIDPRKEETASETPSAESAWEEEFRRRLDWWSLKPLRPVDVPKPFDCPWGVDPIDRFVKARLDAAGLRPAPPATPEVLLRRLSFVLTGLPPTPDLRDRFLKATQGDTEKAYERLVDELLASPHYGERFARRWMDVARYTDTYGYEWDNPAKGSHEYRDYLVRAFNGDLPFDAFVREQIAGDLLPSPRIDAALGVNESLAALMFNHMGEHRHGSSLAFNGVHQEMINNKIEAFSKTFLASTVACARCHDHKYEPVSQRDYYALGAVFMTPRWTTRVVDAPGRNDAALARLKTLRRELRTETAALWRMTAECPESWPDEIMKRAGGPKDKAAKPATIEEIRHPIARLTAAGVDPVARWKELAAEWRTAREARRKSNQSFTVLADFATPKLPDGWVAEGDGIAHGYVDEAEPQIALEGAGVFAALLPRGYNTGALSSKLPGALRSPPDHEVPGSRMSLRLAGGRFGGTLEVHENAFQGEEVGFFDFDQPRWRTYPDKTRVHGISKITHEFATPSLNPNFPPRTGLAPGLPHNDYGYDKRGWIGVTEIVAHEGDAVPQDTLDAFEDLYSGKPPETADEVPGKVRDWFARAVLRWCEGKSRPGDQVLLDWMLANKLLPNAAPARSRAAELLAEYRRIEAAIPFPRVANGLDERDREKAAYPLNVRGNVDVLGDRIAPRFLSMLAGLDRVAESSGSGRLELAESLTRPDHPLTARVYVNRVWLWTMGSGIVPTPDDFGRLGEKPTHPELLDHLAAEFIRNGWSTKALVRRLVLTRTFRQSGLVDESARARDPDNRLRHHYPTRRLEAEAIRDSLLAVSGRLDPKLGGRPILPHRKAEDGAKRLFSGPLDGEGRRSLYLQISIMEPPRFLVGFNLPDPRLPTGRRDETNVPAQALILLNDPFVAAMAKHWSSRLARTPHADPAARVTAMFVEAFARTPSEAESKRWTAAVSDFRTPGVVDPMKDEAAWAELGHAMFNAKEFIHYR